ncbi:MAG: 50S ribosome-binding GTPase [Nanoarchaeota archaeon]|nr:50S ribosome-binding GTPase [Nanoarchaeota archaeon]
MNFQNLKPIENYQFFLDLAFRRARDKGDKLRSQKLKGGRLEKSKYIEVMKMQVISDTLFSRMESIVKSYPSFDQLPEFYKEMVKLHVDYVQLKKSLAALNWLGKKSLEMFKIYHSKLDKNRQFDRINILKREFLGRVSSLVKQVRKDFVFLEEARRIMKKFPTIKTSLKTVAIVGFPNVGKTTLLYKLTGSKPEINSYPFTTKGVNVSYIGKGKDRIQLLDTPGTLNRFEKMNDIERIAYLAVRHCADMIVYVFDPTEEYPIENQAKLYKRLKQDFGKNVIVYLSKRDMVGKEKVEQFSKEYAGIIVDAAALEEEIMLLLKMDGIMETEKE